MTKHLNKTILVLLTVASLLGASPIPWPAYQGPGVSGRFMALSGAAAGVRDDAALVFWNPAGLAFMQWPMATAGYTQSAGVLSDPLFSGPKRLNYLAFTGQSGGFAWRSLARYQQETAAAAGPDTAFDYLKYSVDEFALAFAKKDDTYPAIALGLSAKLIWARLTQQTQATTGGSYGRAALTDENGVGYGLDLGLAWTQQPLRLFANFQNLLAKVYFRAVPDDKPKVRATGGVAWQQGGGPALSLGVEKYLYRGSPRLQYMAAAEYKRAIENFGAVTGRIGYAGHYRAKQDYSWSWGLGYLYGKFLLDAAAVNQRDPGDGSWKATYVGSVSLFLN